MRVAGVGFGPRPDRCAVGVDRLDVDDPSSAPPPAATASVIVVVWVMALVTVIVALATGAATDGISLPYLLVPYGTS